MKLGKTKNASCAKRFLLPLITILVGLWNPSYGQFKENVRQSYLCYNSARLALAAGKTDSAATYMEQSIRLNDQNANTRFEAWDVFMKAGRYHTALIDINNFYRNKELPDDMLGYFFSALDSTNLVLAKKNREIQLFMASYDSLKMEHRKLYARSNPFKELVTKCQYIDQFARDYADEIGSTSSGIISYADRENIKAMGEYIKTHSLPSSAEDPTVISCFGLFLHWVRDTGTYRNYPGWQTIHDALLTNVFEGKYDVRKYVGILELQHVAFTKKLLFGIFTNKSPAPNQPNRRVLQADLDDVAHVDDRRKQWLQPTLYEESIINGQELQFPVGYKR